MREKKGISLIALIITIIVIIILAAIVIGVALNTPENANRAKFASDISEVQHSVATKLAENYNQYLTNPNSIDLNAGFTRVSISGAPESFNSFALQGEETGTMGYLVKLDTIKMDQLTIGQEYKTATDVTFGTTDAFVYDAKGEVFYALGYRYQDKIYYSKKDLVENGIPVEEPGEEEPGEEEPEPIDPSLLSGVNVPLLGTGMIEVYWDGFTEIAKGDADFDVTNWYDYIAQAGGTVSGGTSKWANAKLNGSYFVWIPRFAYKITYYTDASKTTISGTRTGFGTIDVLFMYGTSSTEYIDKATNSAIALPAGYKIHPAFTSDISKGGWDSELSGIWVGKYEASHSDATSASRGSAGAIKVVPQVKPWDNITIGNAYANSLNYNTTLNSHMLKNSEWGAVAYLAYSKYGRNTSDITINSNNSGSASVGLSITGNAGSSLNASASASTYAYNTPQGIFASTTGNIFGVYDMKGGLSEFVACYWPNTSDGNFVSYGGNLVCIDGTSTKDYSSTKYSTVYSTSSAATGYIEGDGTYQTQWDGDMSGFFASSSGIIQRGGPYDYGTYAGLFSTTGTNGGVGSAYGFRICLIP